MSDSRTASRRPFRGCLPWAFLLSVIVNFVICGFAFWPSTDRGDDGDPVERVLYGNKNAKDKIAVVRAQGALVEGLDVHILRQIQTAAKDPAVKAVVLRIDSPGGTIGASEDIYRELVRMKTGQHPRLTNISAKPIVASMGAIAASGGYYIAMPAEKIFAEKSTITGSIGVYASFPNVSELANKNGVKFELIKAGGIKASGSPFHTMTPQERQPWQEMVDQAYDQFLDVVATGRPKLTKEQLKAEVVAKKRTPEYDDKGNPVKNDALKEAKTVEVLRYRADGGTFTATEAKKHDLIDEIGLLEDAVVAAAAAAGTKDYRVVQYDRLPTLLNSLLGINLLAPSPGLQNIAEGLTPRLWYLAPQSELSGIIAASAVHR